ncbi:MAG: FAD-binding oxidoreductase [Bacteroidetes bacterium]|nr:FAD-binding oxidoreductase [Bacteroidota bacterium]
MSTQAGLSWWESRYWQKVDVVVVGAGIVGLLSALRIREQKPHYRIVVTDRDPLALGASSRNAGFACFGSITELQEDIEDKGREAALDLAVRRFEGFQALRALCGDEAIGLNLCGSREVFLTSEEKKYREALEWLPELNKDLASTTGTPETFRKADTRRLGMNVLSDSLVNCCEGILETDMLLRRLRNLAAEQGIELYGGFDIEYHERDGKGLRIRSGRHEIETGLLLYCTNAFTPGFFPELPIVPARGQVFVSTPLSRPLPNEAFFYDRGYTYFRPLSGNRLLMGGFRNLDFHTEETYAMHTGGAVWEALLRFTSEVVLPAQEWKVDFAWAGTMAMGDERSPIVRSPESGVVVCARMSGMGVALSAKVSVEATELLMKQAY